MGLISLSGLSAWYLAEAQMDLCLVQAHAASLLDAVEAGHVGGSAASAVRDAFEKELQTRGFLDAAAAPTAKVLTARDAWASFGAAILTAGDLIDARFRRPHKLADRRTPTPIYKDSIFVTLGPLHHHVDLIRRGAPAIDHSLQLVSRTKILSRKRDMSFLEKCALSLNEGLKAPGARSAYLKGSSDHIAWLAPEFERVAALVATRVGMRLPQADTDQLRDLLGLWSENGRVARPLALFRCEHTPLYAPNVVTARTYERFRHRPRRRLAAAPMAGLTYNLDPVQARRHPGSCELVAVGVTMDQVIETIACGMPSAISPARSKMVAAYLKYAETARDGRSWATIVKKLDELIS
jgi:hypothetical protein